MEFIPGDKCIVETEEGLAFGEVSTEIKMVPENQIGKPLRKVVRKATRADLHSGKK